MIIFKQGNIFDADTEAIVNAVNAVGVMGAGIALMFKEVFPDNYRLYKQACKRNEVLVGHMFVTENPMPHGPLYIINFPTKQHWNNFSNFEWIVKGLKDLRRVIGVENIQSIAIPALGCGYGGLSWREVKKAIVNELDQLNKVKILVYEPKKGG